MGIEFDSELSSVLFCIYRLVFFSFFVFLFSLFVSFSLSRALAVLCMSLSSSAHRVAPTIVSLTAVDGGSPDGYAAGDMINVTFSRATNQATLSSSLDTSGVNSLFSFSQSIGSAYSGTWVTSAIFIITCVIPADASPKIGLFTITPIHPNLRDALSISSVITSVSPVLNGTFVSVTGLPSLFFAFAFSLVLEC